MKEKELTAAESLKLIERTIEQSRRDVATASAQPLLVWGGLVPVLFQPFLVCSRHHRQPYHWLYVGRIRNIGICFVGNQYMCDNFWWNLRKANHTDDANHHSVYGLVGCRYWAGD